MSSYSGDDWNENKTELTVTFRGSNYFSVGSDFSYSGDVTIPEFVLYEGNNYRVTSIGDNAFYGCWGVLSWTIIEDNAFGTYGGLTSVSIPNSVTSIGNYAFSWCGGLTSIDIPDSVTSIGDGAFRGTGLISVTIGNSVIQIGEVAFENCNNLASIVIDKANSIYDSRDKCNAIIKTADNELIQGCLTTVIPNSVTSIGDYAFKYLNDLSSISIPNSVETIGDEAFEGCVGLTSVTIGNSVTKIGNKAFYDCHSLTSVHISDLAAWCNINFSHLDSNPLYYAHHLFLNGAEIKYLQIPSSVTSVNKYAFMSVEGLVSIVIPNSVITIGDGAFQFCI